MSISVLSMTSYTLCLLYPLLVQESHPCLGLHEVLEAQDLQLNQEHLKKQQRTSLEKNNALLE